ncbi:related to deacetylase [Cephalotrichum gorgonifer]|uniref:Related to deacetylase n=1 Tax=Cephalotrichum gorgonifer TaxID=2041049 RepID=A0AAE8N712_9PEZI|nr:related to deacetylase [Cephalotrichum gorgonifer]
MASRLIVLALAAAAAASPVSRIQRRQAASVIASCTKPGVVALTFDDGPFDYTESVLDQFAAAGFKATFFVNGDNFGNIYDHASTVQRAVAEGHQIGSHTWSHPDIATLSSSALEEQMSKLDDALADIIGKTPTYMRPPFFSWNSQNLATLGALGYKVIHADVDTLDWQFDYPASIANFNNGIDAGGSIVLAHDVHAGTVNTLVPAMIASLKARGLKSVTVGECIGDAPVNWYKGGSTDPEPEPTPTPTPSEPSEPTPTPTEPSEPTSTPDEPSEPTPTPSKPTEPEEPYEPTPTPSKPTEPGYPEESNYPEEPTPTSSTPTEPGYPEEPTPTPTKPSKPPHSCYKKRQLKQ